MIFIYLISITIPYFVVIINIVYDFLLLFFQSGCIISAGALILETLCDIVGCESFPPPPFTAHPPDTRLNMKKRMSDYPSVEELETELNRVKYQKRYWTVMKSTIYTLITVAAIAVLVATLWLPVLRIYGSSMTPTLEDGQIVFSVRTGEMNQGDVIAFYYNNKILVKRVIAGPGDWVDLKEDGTVWVNGEALDEPYLTERSFGGADIEFPYQVPDGKVFVMGDHRSTSVDSRHTAVGCVAQEQVVGKIVFRIWPLNQISGF